MTDLRTPDLLAKWRRERVTTREERRHAHLLIATGQASAQQAGALAALMYAFDEIDEKPVGAPRAE